MQQRLRKLLSRKWLLNSSITLLAVVLAYVFALTGIMENLEYKFYDLRFEVRGEISTQNSNIVIVAIDDQSFVSLQQKWPFPRRYFGRAIRNLKTAGAKLIIVDIEFSEASQYDPADDRILAAAVRDAGNVILAGKIAIEYGRYDLLNKFVIPPIDPLLESGAVWGYANVDHDLDGFIRKYSLFQRSAGKLYFPLVVEAVAFLKNLTRKQIYIHYNNKFIIGRLQIPKYEFNNMLINYAGPAKNFQTFSFTNILDDHTFDVGAEDTDIFDIYKREQVFKDKIVLIGASAEELQDNKFTPFFDYNGVKRKMPGVEMHANTLHAILSENHVRHSPFFFEILLLVIMAVLAVYLSRFKKPYKGIVGVAATIIVYMASVFIIFIKFEFWIQIILPLSALIFSFVFNTTHRVFDEQREKGRYRKTFQQYVAQSVVDTMLNTQELPRFGGERRYLTILFSDIRAFTTFSEKYAPEIVVGRLSDYLTNMVKIIFRHDGTLDKFIGDEIMALYGAPYFFENHAERACLTALDMLAELKYLLKKWQKSKVAGFDVGIGINTGRVIVGNLGSIQLFDYTVIGDEVNLCSRLESANKFYNTNIIISDSTLREVEGKAIVRELDNVRLRGKQKPVKIYELCGMYSLKKDKKELLIDRYQAALADFRERNWVKALNQFRYILRHSPQDGPSQLYIRRCLDFIEAPPPEEWDGIFELNNKLI